MITCGLVGSREVLTSNFRVENQNLEAGNYPKTSMRIYHTN
jgi:hypothetical protein